MSKVRSKRNRLTAHYAAVADTDKSSRPHLPSSAPFAKSAVKKSDPETADRHFNLPRGWKTARIGDVLRLYNGAAFKPSDWTERGLPIIRIQNLNNPGKPFNYFAGERHPRFRARKGDLLFAWSGTPGTSFGAHIWKGGDAWLNQHIFRVEFDTDLFDCEFLRLAINRNLQAYIAEAHGGAGLAHITKGKFESFSIFLPPLAEQRRIMARLGALEARSRRARVLLVEVPAQLAQARQSLLAAAFRGELTYKWRTKNKPLKSGSALRDEVRAAHRRYAESHYNRPSCGPELVEPPRGISLPKTWAWIAGVEVVEPGADIIYGIIQPGPKLEEGVPYVRGTDIQDGKILLNQLLKTSAEIAMRYSRSALVAGDVLLGIIRATKVAVVPPELNGGNITQGTARFRPSSVISTEYLSYALQSPETQSWLHAHYRGIDMPGLNLADVRRVPIPLPPLSEQREIVRRLEAALARVDATARAHAAAVAELDRLDQSLLARAFSGTLVAQDPADEPATQMLARLSAEASAR